MALGKSFVKRNTIIWIYLDEITGAADSAILLKIIE